MERSSETITFLDSVLQDVQTAELTQQIRLSDGMPDVGRILASWGQVILRGKEWQEGEASVNGGVLIWVLYMPEDGSGVRCLDSWIPFQMKWDLPEQTPEGNLWVQCQLRFVDGRSVSPRKVMVRCGISARAEGTVSAECEAERPTAEQQGVEMLENTYPLRLWKEAGEKAFLLDEELTLPDSAPQPEKLILCRMEPRIIDSRVLSDKLAFRGTANLRAIYRSEEGQLQSWDIPVSFSQIAELEREYGPDARADLIPAVTNLEAELDEEGHIRLKCGLTAQYRLSDRHLLCIVEDAYCPGREISLETEILELPVVLEQRRETVFAEQNIPAEAERVVDVSFLPDFPRERRENQDTQLYYPGNLQVLYYGNDGTLQANSQRWEAWQKGNAHEESVLIPALLPGETQLRTGSGQIQIRAEIPVDMTVVTDQRFQMVTEAEPGERIPEELERPTLILRRAGESRLWDIAKGCGSTVDKIRRANDLQGEPAPDRMLLIPLG